MKSVVLLSLIVLGALASGSTYDVLGSLDDEPAVTKSFVFHDVCLDMENNRPTISYYRNEEDDIPPLSDGPVASLGGRALAYLRSSDKPFPKDTVFEPSTLVIYSSQGNTLPQLILDTLYGAYWSLYEAGYVDKETGEVLESANVAIAEVGRPSLHSSIARGIISQQNPSVYRTLIGHCYSTVIVGNAGHRALSSIKGLPGMAKPEEIKETFGLFRGMIRNKSKSKGDEEYGESHVLLSHRMGDHRISNSFDLVEAVGKIAEAAQIAFLAQLPFFARVQMMKAASVFVTAHSEDMLYASFLDPRGTVLEVMPYGCTDDTWERFCDKYGIKYMKWQNEDRSKTVLKPGILTRFGIDAETKKKILEADSFDPETQTAAAAAYWDDQDTTVNVDEVIALISDVIPKKEKTVSEKKPEPEEEEEVTMKSTHKEEL